MSIGPKKFKSNSFEPSTPHVHGIPPASVVKSEDSSMLNSEEAPLLNIEYLTQDEKQEQAAKLSKKIMCSSPRDSRMLGYDRQFMTRANTIQLYQYIQAVCRYGSHYDADLIDEETFYSEIRSLRCPSGECHIIYSLVLRIKFYVANYINYLLVSQFITVLKYICGQHLQ